MLRRLNTTTALIASLSLIAAGPAFPQQAQGGGNMVCADGSAQPCPEGVELVPAKKAQRKKAQEARQQRQDEAGKNAKKGAAAEQQPAGEAPAQTKAKPAQKEARPARQEAKPGQQQAKRPRAAQQDQNAPEDDALGQALQQQAEPAPRAAEPAPEQDQAAPEDDALGKALQQQAEPGDGAGAEQPESAAPAATATGQARQKPAGDGATGNARKKPKAAARDGQQPAGGQRKKAAAATDQEQPAPVLPDQPDAASGKAPTAAAATAAAGEAAPADAEVTEEVVTEETARSSDEDFATSVSKAIAPAAQKQARQNRNARNQPAQPAPAASEDKGGLTDTQKAILLGIGAVAVGSMLSNNRRVELNSGDRVVLERPDGSYQIIKDDNALLRQPGSTVRTERFDDGSSRTTVLRPNGSRIVTIRDAEYRVLRRIRVAPDGRQVVLFDDTVTYAPVDVSRLPPPAPVIEVTGQDDEAALRAALSREADFDRSFSLAQIRDIEQVRALVPEITLDAITFETGSAAIQPDQARALSRVGNLMKSYIDEDPGEVFLIEGHTDAVGSAVTNLALSDRRAESVALALTEYFDVPPENMVVQGYGEEDLKVPTDGPERANRRAAVRRITDLLTQAAN